MIHIDILRCRDDDSIRGFKISGHANYAPKGEDIVCAGVSAISAGIVNAIEELTGVVPLSEVEDGFLQCRLAEQEHDVSFEKTQLLLQSFVIMMQTIRKSYKKYVQIHDKYL